MLPARYYATLCARLDALGIPSRGLLRRARIASRTLTAPGATLARVQVERLLATAIAASGRVDLGCLLGAAIRPGDHEVLGHALLSAGTLEQALQLAARYWSLLTPAFDLRVQHADADLHAIVRPLLPWSHAALDFHLETIAFALHAELVALCGGRMPPGELRLSMARPAHAPRYRRLAPLRVQFAAERLPGLRLVVPAAAARRPLPRADVAVLQAARQRCDAALQRHTRDGSLSDWVAMMLREAQDGPPSLSELAALLHVSPRTLHRRLAAEGRGFHALREQARHTLACELLRTGGTIGDVATRLGYRDAANFTRAFRAIEGVAPSAYRARRATSEE